MKNFVDDSNNLLSIFILLIQALIHIANKYHYHWKTDTNLIVCSKR